MSREKKAGEDSVPSPDQPEQMPLSRLLYLMRSGVQEDGLESPGAAEEPPEPEGGTAAEDAPGAVAEAGAILVTEEGLSTDEVARILAERARTLAQVPPAEEVGEIIPVVVFALGEETYAVEAGYVEGIYLLEDLTPVPCTPAFVLGVINLRGRILSVVDVHRFLGLKGLEVTAETYVIAVRTADLEVGLLASDVYDVRLLRLEELERALPTTAKVAVDYTRGIAPDMAVLLDLVALLSDDRIVVQEEVV